jgi:hypothetical protein
MAIRTPALIVSIFVFAAILAGTGWATSQQSIVPALQSMWNEPTAGNNPWLWATLVDAYLGFFWFWCWIALRERSRWVPFAWIPALLLTGNFAMAVYTIVAVLRLPARATARDLLLGSLAQDQNPKSASLLPGDRA